MATSDGTFGEMRFDQSDQSFVDASQPLEQLLRDAEAALEAVVCAIKVGQPAPIKQVDEKVKAVWHAWNLMALKETLPSQPKEIAHPVVGEKRELLPRRNTADLKAKARTGRDDVNAFHNTPDDDDANGDGTDLLGEQPTFFFRSSRLLVVKKLNPFASLTRSYGCGPRTCAESDRQVQEWRPQPHYDPRPRDARQVCISARRVRVQCGQACLRTRTSIFSGLGESRDSEDRQAPGE
jgi:hypothetical protein